MNRHFRWLALVVSAVLGPGFAQAQVALDDTLIPGNSNIDLNVAGPGAPADYRIESSYGIEAGDNLFHSFSDFALSQNERALFTGPANIENIISRVTGPNPSPIDGIVASDIDGANLFLINPNGVIFGPNASLDVRGSFHASTADLLTLQTSGGIEFAAFSPQSLVTFANPVAFGFLDATTAPIDLDGSNLAVLDGNEITLTGGDISLSNGASLSAAAQNGVGGVSLVSVVGPGEARFGAPGQATDVASFQALGTIAMSSGSSIDTSGEGSGRIFIRGGDLVITNSSLVAAAGDEDGLPIDVSLRESVTLQSRSELRSESNGAGTSGSIALDAGSRIDLLTDSQVISTPLSTGDGGDILVTTHDLFISGDGGATDITGINTINNGLATATGGRIDVRADTVEIDSGGRIKTFTRGGTGGDVHVEARRMVVTGGTLNGPAASVVSTETRGSGIGGEMRLTIGERLEFLKGARGESILMQFSAGGSTGGDLVIDAPNATVLMDGFPVVPGRADLSIFSGLRSQASPEFFPLAPGRAGDIDVTADRLELRDGAHMTSVTFSSSHAGDIKVQANDVIVSGFNEAAADFFEAQGSSRDIARSQIATFSDPSFAFDPTTVTGDSGSLTIDAKSLVLSDLGELAAATVSAGDAGEIVIRVDTLDISTDADEPSGELSGILAGSFSGAAFAGQSGSIDIEAKESIRQNNGVISVLGRTVPGGTIDLAAPEISIEGEGGISSRATGNVPAGNIRLVASDDIFLKNTLIAAESGGANGGNVELTADRLIVLDNATVSGTVLAADGTGGNVSISAPAVLMNDATVIANAQQGAGGRIVINSRAFLSSENTVLSATSEAGPEFDGEVVINAPGTNLESSVTPLPTSYLDGSRLLSSSCAAQADTGGGSSFVVARRRISPASPEGMLIGAPDELEQQELITGLSSDERRLAMNDPNAKALQAQLAFSDALTALRGGRPAEAIAFSNKAADLFEEVNDSESQSDALRYVATSQQATGDYSEAIVSLGRALEVAEKSGDDKRSALALNALGDLHAAMGDVETAEKVMLRGIGKAKSAGDPSLAQGMLNSLGNQYADREQIDLALEVYQRSARLAESLGDVIGQTKALSNAARLASRSDLPEEARARAEAAWQVSQSLPETKDKLHILIHLARTYEEMARDATDDRSQLMLRAHAALQTALVSAEELEYEAARSYALGNLGTLYLADARPEEALFLTRKALRSAKQGDLPDAVYRWNWQEARVLWQLGRSEESIDAYRRALALLEEIRPVDHYAAESDHFREAMAPVYREFVDTLFKASDLAQTENRSGLLMEARSTMEALKTAELRDYFRDECFAGLATPTTLDQVSSSAAVIYPVIFEKRLELLVNLPSGITRKTVAVTGARLRAHAEQFRNDLTNVSTNAYMRNSEQLYDWLVRPYLSELRASGVDTLVFLPDGILRTIPMAALHSGEGFLIEEFSLAIAPSLNLVDPRPLTPPEGDQMLLAGVSESVEGFPPLEKVPDELRAIQRLYGGEIMLNEDFDVESIQADRETEPIIVHIASHAVFTGDPETSFLLTYDGHLTMRELGEFVGKAQRRKQPLELLVLSACETAIGDERAALGLAGVAIRAGARSALGSLWSISDEGTFELISEFYRSLKEPGSSRASALQAAQASLLKSEEFSHPFFWSPFLMINNWL